MEEGVAAPVGGFDPAAQIVPIIDGMNGFVPDDLFEDVGGALPVDPPRHQEAAVEPGAEQVLEIEIGPPEAWIVLEQGEQPGPHLHQFAGGAGNPVDAAQQFLPPRFGSLEQAGKIFG